MPTELERVFYGVCHPLCVGYCCIKSCELWCVSFSREILRKCHSLPLVIAATAGLLSTKEKSVLEWKRVVDNLNYEICKVYKSFKDAIIRNTITSDYYCKNR